jgi:mannan endo-1,4-beta-mannosidase
MEKIMRMKKFTLLALMATIVMACSQNAPKDHFVKVDGVNFTIDGNPYYFVGTNYWYGAILGSKGRGGDRIRLIRELDLLKEMGVTNLRVLVGAEGPDNQPYRVTPALQLAPGVYNDTIFDGLDFLMAEMGKRQMRAVLFLNNTWEWSGGFSQYVNWNGGGDIPYPQIAPNTWPQFMAYASQFLTCDSCRLQFKAHIKHVLGRTNRYTNVKYTDDPWIMTWEIANEPRALVDEKKEVFAEWIEETAAYIKSLDANHLVTTGTEGSHGCQNDMELFRSIHSSKNIDYLVFHIWPKNWGWIDESDIPGSIDAGIAKTDAYFDSHLEVAKQLNKPAVFEEFGLPRDNHLFSLDDPTTARDKYYGHAFSKVEENAASGGALAGTNFWAFGGYARHTGDSPFWKNGDDLMGDPPQEEQGLNAVFDTDSTIDLIKAHAAKLNDILNKK